MAKKPTVRMLETRIDLIEQQMGQYLSLVAKDMNQVIAAVSALLDHQGLLAQVNCESCGTELTYPALPGVGAPEMCPACNSKIDGSSEEE